jgi:beta-N-acetylglucosaminidase
MSKDQGVFDYTMRLRSLAKDSSVMKIVSEINQITGKEIVFAGKINIMLNEQENSFAMLDLNSSEIINIKNLNEKKSNQGVLQINLGLNSDVIKATLEKYLEDVKLVQEQKRKSNEAAMDLSLNQSDENAINLINGT